MPTGVTAKSPNVSMGSTLAGRASFELRIRSLSRIRGLDPTMVMVPPSMAQKPMGMSRREMGI